MLNCDKLTYYVNFTILLLSYEIKKAYMRWILLPNIGL